MRIRLFARYGFRPTRRAGFTLTEVAIVLGIVGIVIGAVWVASGNIGNSSRINQASDELDTIVSNAFAFYAGQNVSVAALNTANPANPLNIIPLAAPSAVSADFCYYTSKLTAAKVFPPQMIKTPPAYAYNVFNKTATDCSGAVGTAQVSLGQDANSVSSLGVRYSNVPYNACAQLLLRNSTIGLDTRLTEIRVTWVGGSAAHTDYIPGTLTCSGGTCPLPMSATDANTGCNAGTGTLYIDWYYQLGG